MEFQKRHGRHQKVPIEEFLDTLVKIYEVQSREELGIFYRSWAYLIKVM
jgi:hypothetical protein